MHSMLHYQMYRTLAADRVEQSRAVTHHQAAPAPAAGTRTGGVRRGPDRSPAGLRVRQARGRIERRPAPSPGAGLCSRAVDVRRLEHCEPFITLDGSEIRELAGVPTGNAANQSLAQATVPPGSRTEAHFHRASEEIYVFTAGAGRMLLGDEQSAVGAGDCVVIAPGTAHQLVNDGAEPLVLLCCCSPPYSDADTVILPPGT